MKLKAVLGGALLASMLAAPASAAPITGILNLTGSVQVTATTIDWLPLATGEGIFTTAAPGTGYFSGIFNPAIVPAYFGNEVDLTAGTVFPLANFLNDFNTPLATTAPYNDLSFTLTGFASTGAPPICTGTEALNASCILFAGSPFVLTQRTTGVDVTLGVLGFFVDPTEGPGNNTANGIYTTQLTGNLATIAAVRNVIVLGGNAGWGPGAIQSSYSATYTATAVPEPVTLTLLGLGLAGTALRRRRG
jgi:hypothetical protein